MARKEIEIKKWGSDKDESELIKENLDKQGKGYNVNSSHVRKIDYYKTIYSNKLPEGETREYTKTFYVESRVRRKYEQHKKRIFEEEVKPSENKEQEKKNEDLAKLKAAALAVVQEIYDELIKMYRVGITEFYAQYSPMTYARLGRQFGTQQIEITDGGMGIHMESTGDIVPKYSPRKWHGSWTSVTADYETMSIIRGKRLPDGFPLQTGWSFSYSGGILAAYVLDTMDATFENVASNFNDIVNSKAHEIAGV